ncbi:MAG TPA: hypothetical protein VNJ01_15285 [Bacteriovoracaceae bacterium]|nr:hypothetical protein [Bacteriovoracaceae bacterium]
MVKSHLLILSLLFILGACASRLANQMKAYREAYQSGDYDKAEKLLEKSALKKKTNSKLLWHLEKGTVSLAKGDENDAIANFQTSLDLIDQLYTTKLGSKAASLFVNDASDEFYGASYERSYAHYFLTKAYYARYLKSDNKLDLQGARGTILAWDSYFTQLQRSASAKTLYHTDLMLKVFGGVVHEISEVKNDKQIALQLYKDALKILDQEGGIFSLFNSKHVDYVKAYETSIKTQQAPPANLYQKTNAYQDLKDFLHYKMLSLTKDVRGSEFQNLSKTLAASKSVLKKIADGPTNVVVVLEEGLIPSKVGKPFNFGLRGAAKSVKNPAASAFIATVGTEVVTAFAMNKLGMAPTQTTGPGSFLFAHSVTRLAVQEAAVEFELPMIEEVPVVQRLELFVLSEEGVIVDHHPLPVVSENGDIARVVLEEDVVSKYVKTGTRVAVRHLVAIVGAMQVYNGIARSNAGGFIAQTAAMGTYVAAAKGIASLEKADTRHWRTLPQALRMSEFKLAPGKYQVAVAAYSGEKVPESPSKILGNIEVKSKNKSLHHLKMISP